MANNNTGNIRVRFAPAPTGMMHLGNIRTALMNYLFARKYNGTFVLRIEDTDTQRNFDPQAEQIQKDLHWLGFIPDEGPSSGGPYKPYFQSLRLTIYQEKLDALKQLEAVYRCFCTQEELEKKKKHQELLRMAPRYDRTCMRLSDAVIKEKLEQQNPYIWRFKLNHEQSVKVNDISHGTTIFELKNFSDFPLTRTDGTFTFLFANFVDDFTMHISHVFRGEDHKSNTANQAALYEIFKAPLPHYWHLPILCNSEGKKLSKRDFGFSLNDLKNAGFLPEAICNYLGIIGGSYPQEIMNLDELAHTINLEHPSVTGQIKYDVEKLKWINHKWIAKLSVTELAHACRPFLQADYPILANLDDPSLGALLAHIQTDLVLLQDSTDLLSFYKQRPVLSKADIRACFIETPTTEFIDMLEKEVETFSDAQSFINILKKDVKKNGISLKELFWFLRLTLMGKTAGPAIHSLIEMLGISEAKIRIAHGLSLLK